MKIPKRVIRFRKSKKSIQYDGQKKRDKRSKTIYKTLHRKLKIDLFNKDVRRV